MPTPDSFQVDPINPAKVPQKIGPGHPPPSRRRGVANKITRDLKRGILDAASNIGRDGHGAGGLTGFLEDLALNHKKCFSYLLAKVLPMSVGLDNSSAIPVVSINVIGIASGCNHDGSPMATVSAPVIEHAPRPMRIVSSKPTRAEMEALSVEELKALARERGIDVDGLTED